MDLEIRQLTDADMKQAMRLGAESFGNPPTPDDELPSSTREGREWFGAFDGDLLVGQAINREFHSWFGGVAIPTAGVAFVGVTAEYRGRGIVRSLLDAVLASAVERGSVVSTLFPTAPRIYRGLGYERITDMSIASVPTSALSGLPTSSTTTRRATDDDLDAIRGIYDAWAAEQNGVLTRTSPSMGGIDAGTLAELSGVTLAVDSEGSATGYAAWNRGEGYGDEATIEVLDLIARSADAYQALLTTLGSFSGVAPTTTIRTSGDDVVRLLLPTSHWKVNTTTPYMLSILDVDQALSLRGYPAAIAAELTFSVDGGRHLLSLKDGSGSCTAVDHDDTRELTPQGLASLFAGAQSCANLRSTSQLIGGDRADDEAWDAAFGGRQVHIRDYF